MKNYLEIKKDEIKGFFVVCFLFGKPISWRQSMMEDDGGNDGTSRRKTPKREKLFKREREVEKKWKKIEKK